MSSTASPSLSRFVQTYAASATTLAAGVYTTARTYVPAFAEPYVQQAEETAVAFTAPYVTAAQDKAEKVLSSLDSQLDASVQLVSSALSYAGDLHTKNLATFNGAKEQCFGLVESTVASAKALVDPSPYVQWAAGQVGYWVDPDRLLNTSFEVAGKVASFGPVPKVLETADPLIKTSKATYEGIHDTLVSLPVYKQVWELVLTVGSSAQDTWVFKKWLELGYPVVAPVADPVRSNFANSKYLKQLQSHLAPAKKA